MSTYLLGDDPKMEQIRFQINNLARFDRVCVLFQGETGTGKEAAARLLHEQTFREHRVPFTVVDLASLDVEMASRELFGNDAGAFTSAKSGLKGLIEHAGAGTIFFDEVGVTDSVMQRKLLRLVENREYRRLGSVETKVSKARFIFATSVNLALAVERKEFQSDLYYRLSGFTIELPPLRNRRGDIPELVDHFLANFWCNFGGVIRRPMSIEQDALVWLASCDWPGNVRQLQRSIESAAIRCSGRDSDVILRGDFDNVTTTRISVAEPIVQLDELVKARVEATLASTAGNKVQAARILGISRMQLYGLIRKHGISAKPEPSNV